MAGAFPLVDALYGVALLASYFLEGADAFDINPGPARAIIARDFAQAFFGDQTRGFLFLK